MKEEHKKALPRRILLGVLQHVIMAFAAFIVITVFQESTVRVDNFQGNTGYRVDPFEDSPTFEDSEVFNQMFYDSVSDLITLIVLRNQFETNGEYDGGKLIDVTSFVNRRDMTSDCPITAVYCLNDLVKWGKIGVEMPSYRMSKKDFVNYFDDGLMDISHYYLDEDGNLRYSGEVIIPSRRTAMEMEKLPEDTDLSQYVGDVLDSYVASQTEKLQEIYDNYLYYNEEQLVNLAFSYVASNIDKPLSVVEDDGGEWVEFQLLSPECLTADSGLEPLRIAENWFDYCKLENNIIEVLESLKQNYELYEQKRKAYAAENTNLQYMFRLQGEGISSYYTNLPEAFWVLEEDEIDYYFQNLGRYLIYSVKDILCESNAWITDQDLYNMVNTHDYAYPEDTVIWIGIPEEYLIDGDCFAVGKQTFDKVVLHARDYTAAVIACLVIWLSLWGYLTFTAGRERKEGGGFCLSLNWFDRIYTEFFLLLVLGLAYFGGKGLHLLLNAVADGGFQGQGSLMVFLRHFNWPVPALGFVCGFLGSFSFCVVWYSLVRRIKYGNLWKDSLLHWVCLKCYQGAFMIINHKSAAVRTLIPYNLFLMVNLAGVVTAYVARDNVAKVLAVIGALLFFDAVIGVYLFRNNAEFVEIVEAIKKIRQGEISYQLDPDRLHGENKEIAQDLNNIGEGIRNAVSTSVRDERLKSDLITNVSHDIKTPLTSIINYVDLMKREKIQQEPMKTYIEILDSKTQRLKQLTDDLVEASKISSGNIVLEKEKLNLTELLYQSIGEFSEKFEEARLQVIFEQKDKDAYIYADSRRMWRVIENLFNNICKYAMPDTRVFMELKKENGVVEATIKNISRQRLSNVRTEELTERFIRGDESRTTEGSGLGLSIAKNLTEVQGGSFQIAMDGDLFKVTLHFPEMTEEGTGI